MSSQRSAKLTKRRKLHFDSIGQCIEEIDRLVAADARGSLHSVGTWTPGQVLSHLAAWIEYGYDGYPIKVPPFPIRWMLRLLLPRILKSGMATGVRIPGTKEGTVGHDPLPTQAGAERLRKALTRLSDNEQALYDSPGFGPMSHADRIRLNLRHAELHLSFLQYD